MRNRTILACAALAAAVLAAPACVAADAAASGMKHKVIFQVSDNDPAKWNLALNNAKNLQADLGAANVDLEIVAYGPGIGMLKIDSPVAQRIDEATRSGVKIVACENTMKGHRLTRADMLDGIGYVGAGVVELMSRQQQGWAYLRP